VSRKGQDKGTNTAALSTEQAPLAPRPALHPHLLVPMPTFMLSLLLLQTYQARYPPASTDPAVPPVTPAQVIDHSISEPTSTGHGKVRPPMVPEPPNEGSIKYYENLRDIQNM
jgi:hypothetical protein